METHETYRQRAEAAERAAEVAADIAVKRMLNAAAQRWRQLGEIAQRNDWTIGLVWQGRPATISHTAYQVPRTPH
jgi:hypothetical protein